MRCERIDPLLIDYADGILRPTENLYVEVHLATCRSCRRALEEVTMIQSQAMHVLLHPEPENHFGRLRAAMAQTASPSRWSYFLPVFRIRDFAPRMAAMGVCFAGLLISVPVVNETGEHLGMVPDGIHAVETPEVATMSSEPVWRADVLLRRSSVVAKEGALPAESGQ